MTEILIKGSRLIDESGIKNADLLVKDGKIKEIGSNLKFTSEEKSSNRKEINAEGLYTMPGIIDPHVHMELPAYNSLSEDDFYSGSMSAAAGGVTTFIDFAIPTKE